MASFVKSIEQITLTLAATESSASALVSATTIADCVPFYCTQITTLGSTEYLANYSVDVYFSGSSVYADRSATEGAIEVLITVVEFDSARVTVQSGTLQLTSGTGSGSSTLGTAVTQTASAFVFSAKQNSTDGMYRTHMIKGALNAGGTAIDWDRGQTDGTADGHYFLFESDSGDFSVEHVSGTIATSTNNTIETITEVDQAKAIILGSNQASATSEAAANCLVSARFESDTSIRVKRYSSTGALNYEMQVLEFDSSTSEIVQSGETPMEGTSPTDVTLTTAVSDIDTSAVLLMGAQGFLSSGRGTNSSQTVPSYGAYKKIHLLDSDTVRVECDVSQGEDWDYAGWAVVEFNVSAAATPRRVWVVS